MREKMHSIYTAVPLRSVRAYAKSGPATLEAVLCAAIVDPANAEDAFEEYGVEGTPHSLPDFLDCRGQIGVDIALQVAAQWTMRQKESPTAIWHIVEWDHRVGVWCACQVAREALRFVPKDEERPRIAIEIAERWVVGDATIEEVCAAAVSAYAASRVASRAAVDAAAADATAAAAYTVTAAADAAAYAAYAARTTRAAASAAASVIGRSRGQVWERARDEELVRLREVIANACMTFPR